ncbi:hypothetical protein SRHO_G00140450 [Serrasalmus rhombeus]
MTERRKKGKKKKGPAVVSLLRMVLLLGCCRGGTSEREDKTLHDRTRTRTLKIKKKPKKSLFSGALGLFRKPGAEKSGRDNNTGVQSQVSEENGQDTSGQHEHTGEQTQVCKETEQDVTGPNDDTVQTVVTGPSSSPPSQTSTNGHKGVSISSVENGTERCRTVTFAADLHPIPGPSKHDDLHCRARVLDERSKRGEDGTFGRGIQRSRACGRIATRCISELAAYGRHFPSEKRGKGFGCKAGSRRWQWRIEQRIKRCK